MTVEAGDVIVADGDGVTVVPGARLADVLAAGEGREAKEAAMFDQLRAGATTVELLGLDVSSIRGAPLTDPAGSVAAQQGEVGQNDAATWGRPK